MIFGCLAGLYREFTREVTILPDSDREREPSTIRLVIEGPMTSAVVAKLCENVRVSVDEHRGDRVVCDLAAVTDPDLGTIDALARLQLTSRRSGSEMRVRNAPAELGALLALVGLERVVKLRVEASRQAEEREEALGVQEEGDPADPVA